MNEEREWVIVLRVQVPERLRRAVANREGTKGLATLRDCRQLCEALLSADLDAVLMDYEQAVEDGHAK